MATFSSPSDSIISPGGNIVGVDLVRQDVPNTNLGGNTIVYEGYTPEACTLAEITVFMKTLNTQGTFTATFTNVTTGNTILGSASFDMQTLSADTWTTLTLTGTASDLTFAADDRFRISFASNNASFDGSGIYFTMRFTSNTSYTPRAMDLLFHDEVTSGTQASFSTGTLPTGYKGIVIDTVARTDGTGHSSSFSLVLNGDTTATNYQTTVVLSRSSVQSNVYNAGYCAGHNNSLRAGFYQGYRTRFLGHEGTVNYKTWTAVGSAHADTDSTYWFGVTYSGTWKNTNAITSITLNAGNGELVVGSSFAVYGIK